MSALMSVLFLAFALFAAPAVAQTSVSDPYAVPSATLADEGQVYARIDVFGLDPDRLIKATSPAATSVELRHTAEDGASSTPVDGFDIAGNTTLQLQPGGDFVLLKGLKTPLAQGDTVSVTLIFQVVGDFELDVPVNLYHMPPPDPSQIGDDPDLDME